MIRTPVEAFLLLQATALDCQNIIINSKLRLFVFMFERMNERL
jgi:hypothetical protein